MPSGQDGKKKPKLTAAQVAAKEAAKRANNRKKK